MAPRLSLLLLTIIGIFYANLGVSSLDVSPDDESWTYSIVTENPDAVKKLYNKYFPEGTETIEALITQNPAIQTLMEKARNKSAKLEMRLLQWTDYLNSLAVTEKQLREYVESYNKLETDTLPNYAEWLLSLDSSAPRGILDKIHNLVAPMFKNQGLIEIVQDFLTADKNGNICDFQMSAHQIVFDVYNTIAMSEIKGYAMMQFSWKILRIYGRGIFTQEARLTRQRYVERTTQTATAARRALAMASQDLYRCDPADYNSENYAEVTRLLQGYIENEVDMNSDGTCKKNCAYYTQARNHGCFKELFCAKQSICRGRVINCQFVESGMWVCPASYNSNRRYEFIRYESERTLGKPGYCDLGMTQVDSWWRWFVHCSYCMCLCDDDSFSSHRYFSLRPAVSDVENNKVVTGVRLIKLGRVFHLQVYQGTLLGRGFVKSSEKVPVTDFDPNYAYADVTLGEDYHKLTYEERAIDLDVVESPIGSVLTGVRFVKDSGHLRLKIQSTPFNYTTGRLFPQQSTWHESYTYRSRLALNNPDLPTRGDRTLRIDSTHAQYVEFTHSDYTADAAQTTVPFLDIQPVLSSKASSTKGATLNSGAGLYHRGAWGSGGFIGVKLVTYDYSNDVIAEPPPEDFNKEDEDYKSEINNEIEAN